VQTVRALLLTDVVDSTQLSQRLGDRAMACLWAGHDRQARDLLPVWRGREIDKTDGMLLLFDSPADAVQYALAYHQALAGLQPPLVARAGLHVGPVLLRENLPDDVARGAKPLEVDGLAKPTAARVMALARGGQTLLSAEAQQALQAEGVPAGLEARSHGHWVLKGVADPVELFELGTPGPGLGAPDDGEKAYRVVRQGERWLPVRQIDNNLPVQLNSFVGRGRELAELTALLGQARMITLLGMGGLGKTRLSLQLAAEQMARFPDGVWFLDLAPLRDGALVVSEAAQALGVRDEPGRPLQQALAAHVQGKRMLLILDNCEHLLVAAAGLAHTLLQAAPQLSCIASSREALRLPGERVYPILPLAVPGAADSAEQWAGSPAVQLFVQRAQAHRPDFQLGTDELPAVAALVARLEGIPLALELAAARVRSMSVADINRRLAKRYQLLTGGSVVQAERQQTLRALVDWSYDMLSPTEQRLLQRVAVFAGGFALDAAEQVCADDDLVPDWEVPDLLGSLVEKSLLGLQDPGGSARYQMLETLRDYAAEKLTAAGDRAATAARHCGVYFTLAKQGRDGLQGPDQGLWVDRLSTEHDNLRVAMATAQAGGAPEGDPFVAVKLAVALQNFWIMRGHVREGRDAVNAMRALPAVQASDQALGHVLYVAAALALSEGDLAEALRLLDDCLARRRALGHATDVAPTLSTRSVTRLGGGDAAGAQADAREALAAFSAAGHRVGEAITLLQLGEAEAFAGDDAAALSHLQAALALARAIKHPETEGEVERVLADLALARGEIDAAAQGHARSLAVCAAAGDLRGEAQARGALARADLAAGRLDVAAGHLQAALQAFDRFAMRAPWLQGLEDTVAWAVQRGGDAMVVAAALAASADQGRAAAGLARSPHAQQAWLALLEAQRGALGPAAFDAARQDGLAWDRGQAHRQALSMLAGG
jgi:predicted ATPase